MNQFAFAFPFSEPCFISRPEECHPYPYPWKDEEQVQTATAERQPDADSTDEETREVKHPPPFTPVGQPAERDGERREERRGYRHQPTEERV